MIVVFGCTKVIVFYSNSIYLCFIDRNYIISVLFLKKKEMYVSLATINSVTVAFDRLNFVVC